MSFPVEAPGGGKQDYGTPPEVYRFLDSLWGFDADAAAHSGNHQHRVYFGPGGVIEDALDPSQRWADHGRTFFLNWPYGRVENPIWTTEAHRRAQVEKITVIGLCFGRYETEWWEDNVDGKAHFVLLLRPRIRFIGAASGAQVPSAAIAWLPGGDPAGTSYATARWKARR